MDTSAAVPEFNPSIPPPMPIAGGIATGDVSFSAAALAEIPTPPNPPTLLVATEAKATENIAGAETKVDAVSSNEQVKVANYDNPIHKTVN